MFDSVMNVINHVVANWGTYMGAAAFWVLAFDRLAKLTPTTKDDSFVNWIYTVFAILGVKVPELVQTSSGSIQVAK